MATAAPSPTIGSSPTAAPTPIPSLTGLAFPTTEGVVLAAGRYNSAPPFDAAFTFEVDSAGWESLHLIGEFFDIARFEGVPRTGPPSDWIGFGWPTFVRGPAGQTSAIGLTPAAAADLLAGRTDLVATNRDVVAIDGHEGVGLDLKASAPNTVVFGGPAGSLGLGPDRDARIVFVPLGGRLLIVLIQALPGTLDAAWQQALPILDSIQL